MKLLQIVTLVNLSIYMVGASNLPSFVTDFLNKVDYNDSWDEDTAKNYVNQLIEKHGAQVEEQINRVTEDEKVAYAQSLRKEAEAIGKKWHVGDVTLTKLDKDVIGSTLSKLRDSTLSWLSQDKTSLQDYGVYLFSVSDTNIFESLNEEVV